MRARLIPRPVASKARHAISILHAPREKRIGTALEGADGMRSSRSTVTPVLRVSDTSKRKIDRLGDPLRIVASRIKLSHLAGLVGKRPSRLLTQGSALFRRNHRVYCAGCATSKLGGMLPVRLTQAA